MSPSPPSILILTYTQPVKSNVNVGDKFKAGIF